MTFGPSSAEWTAFETALFNFSQQTAEQVVTWKKLTKSLSRYGEDDSTGYASRSLKCLVAYNTFRVWPMNKETEAGTLDNEQCYLFINNQYLTSQGWITNGVMNIDPVRDLFIVNGIQHRLSGDTPSSQNKTSPLYTILVLKRDNVQTGANAR